mmetsp:Transcript_75745/g.239537  ORF Transcript_75745/g.239537 Transcript_75745/m.239537 type:complete len:375 (-) Transcript_75745:88-1212(-)
MGWGGASGRGRSGGGRGKGRGRGASAPRGDRNGAEEAEGRGDPAGGGHHAQATVAHAQLVVPPPQPRPLAAQWRFACRVLRRLAPEEKVQDARRQLRQGDHVLVRYSWDNFEQHGIVCGPPPQEARRAERQEPHWVAHWDGSRLQCLPLSQLAKGGELSRVTYPHWACRLLLPATSVARPQVLDELLVEAASDEAVARRASSALRGSGGWRPRWTQGADLEFCLDAKTGGTVPPWELHGRRAIAAAPLASLGCQLHGDRRPSAALGVQAAGSDQAPAQVPAAPVPLPPFPGAGVLPPPLPQALSAADLAAFQHGQFAAAAAAWGAGWWDPSWTAPVAGMGGLEQQAMAAAASGLSPDAQVFVPQMRNSWDGIYQ